MYDIINLWLDDEYGLKSLGGRVRTIVDVGANIGLFSLIARHHFPGARIHAYEPNPAILEYTAANMAAADVTLFREGVSSKPGLGSPRNLGTSRLNKIVVGDEGEIPVCSMTTVAERLGETVDLLKLDCEGAEWEIFNDAAAFTKVMNIRMEYHLDPEHDLATLANVADKLGFKIIHLSPNDGFGIVWMEKR